MKKITIDLTLKELEQIDRTLFFEKCLLMQWDESTPMPTDIQDSLNTIENLLNKIKNLKTC